MRTKVIVSQDATGWKLVLTIDGRIHKLYSRKRLIEVIELAKVLQVHITNIKSLPLNQY